MAKQRVTRTGREGIDFLNLLSPQQPGTSSRIRSRRGMPTMLETPTIQTQSLLANMMPTNNMSLFEIGNAFAEDEKDFEDEVTQEIELKKQTRFGNAMARLGGGITLNEKQRKALSPTAREKYNAARLAARNRGIGEMLLLFSDALAGRDIIGRSMARQQARLPKEKSASKIRDELIRKIQSGEKLTPDEIVTLKVIDPDLAERLQFDPDLTQAITTAIPTQPNIPTITTKEQFDNLPSGASFYFNGNLKEKE